MREGRKWLHLLLAAMLAGSLALAGCSGDDGDDGVNGRDGQDFQLPANTEAGLLACSTCHGATTGADWIQSKHAMNSSHTVGSCATECHNPSGAMLEVDAAFGVSPTGTAVGCEDCHGAGSNHANLPRVATVDVTAPTSGVCGQCHNGEGELAHLTHHPINELIFDRFETSGHADSSHGGGLCSACHSHAGGVRNIVTGRKTSVDQLLEGYSPETAADIWTVDTQWGSMQCNTCHDPHKAGLRTNDTVADITWDDDADAATAKVTEEGVVVYSAEFNLCTTCHMVDLTYAPAGHADAGLLLDYQLSDAYSAAKLFDATTGTFKETSFDLLNSDGETTTTRTVYETQVFYHDNTPGGGRNFADTHFAGKVVGRIAAQDESEDATVAVTDFDLVGYNINAANPNACTVCHDPHTANKVQGAEGVAQAQGFAEGLGDFHTNYLGEAMGHGCKPCHDGGLGFVGWTWGASNPAPASAPTNVIACRTCHMLEQPKDADPTAVRTFADGHVFAFPGYDVDGVYDMYGGVEVDAAELGVSQVCFECHKGRYSVKPDADTTTHAYNVSYLHYAAVFATLFGNESGMYPLYKDASQYSGRSTRHMTGTQYLACADCHNVHTGDVKANPGIVGGMDCLECHGAGMSNDYANIEATFKTYSDRLVDTILVEYNAANVGNELTLEELETKIFARYSAKTPAASDLGAADLAKAGAIWADFSHYDENAWAHNNKFAKQLMYDAIEDLGGDLTGLTRP